MVMVMVLVMVVMTMLMSEMLVVCWIESDTIVVSVIMTAPAVFRYTSATNPERHRAIAKVYRWGH